jgi:hypothetical protein
MLPAAYLRGLRSDPFQGCAGVFALPHHKQPGSWRYVSSYRDGKAHKARIFQLLAQHGQREEPGQWDLHHIVEGQHFADVDFSGELDRVYQEELPVVLIHKHEHIAYNQVLHIRETDELYRDVLPKDMRDRAAATHAAAGNRANHGDLRARTQRLMTLYQRAYADDNVLSTIAGNVFRQALQRLV